MEGDYPFGDHGELFTSPSDLLELAKDRFEWKQGGQDDRHSHTTKISKSAKQNEKDKKLTKIMTAGFGPKEAKNSRAWKVFSHLFRDPCPTIQQIRPIADLFSRQTNAFFPREAQRRKLPLLWWCEQHIMDIEEFLPSLQIVLVTGEVLEYYPW